MVALRLFLCLALQLSTTLAHAAESTNVPTSTTTKKSPADIEGSPEWITKSLHQNESESVVNLAEKYLNGNGVPKDAKKAVELLVCAASFANTRAECYLGVAFDRGLGVPTNAIKAVDWYQAAAFDGYWPALAYLGRAYGNGVVGPPDYAKAFRAIQQAAAFGDPAAQKDAGIMCQEGLGVEPDLLESLKWLQLAVNGGSKPAATRRDEVIALLDSSQRQEANRRVRAFIPLTNYVPALDDSTSVTVPLGNCFQIPVKIFGETNFLVVDTGASIAFLDVNFRGRLGEPLASLAGVTSISSNANFGLRDCPEIFIGERRFAPLLAAVEDFGMLSQSAGETFQGVIGISCLKREVICFDSGNSNFSIGGSVPETVKKTALVVPMRRESSCSYGIDVSINGRSPIFLEMDSGDMGPISLDESDWQKVFAGQSPKTRRSIDVDAEGKIADDRSARIQSLTIGTNTYKNLIVDSLTGPNLSSHFGQGFISRHICYVDFPNMKLYLLPGRHFDRPDESDMSGLILVNTNGVITARSVDQGSPAFLAGIMPGDQILSLNGEKLPSLTMASLGKALTKKPGDEIKMQIKHGAQTNSVKFLLKRLL